MKKNVLFVIISTVSFLLQSCSSDDCSDFSSLSKEEKEFISQFDIVGIKHNEVMAQVYEKISANFEESDLLPNKILEMTLDNTIEATHLSISSTNITSTRLKSMGGNEEAFIDEVLTMGFNLVVNNKTIKLKGTSSISTDLQETVKDALSNKSQKLNAYLKSLLTITEKRKSIEQYNREVNTLIVDALKNLDQEEIEIFLCASSTAKYSCEYWHDNLHNWENMLLRRDVKNIVRLKNDNPESRTEDPRFIEMQNDIIEMDIAGALGGAIAGSITGPGIALCSLAGATGSSTTAAVISIFDNYGETMWEGFKNEWGSIFGW